MENEHAMETGVIQCCSGDYVRYCRYSVSQGTRKGGHRAPFSKLVESPNYSLVQAHVS